MLEIRIEGLAVYAHHGVHAAEKTLGQVFVIDLVVRAAPGAGAHTDQLADTIDYAALARIAHDTARSETYNLLERLADEIAQRILRAFPVREVEVRVRKPAAAVGFVIDAASVVLTRQRPSLVTIGLGANLGDAEATLRSALADVEQLPSTTLRAASHLYRSAPVGVRDDQPAYTNAALLVATSLEPALLLCHLQRIEARFGRRDKGDNAPRLLDLDILLWDETRISQPGLTVPHPRLAERRFALEPLTEVTSQHLPDGTAPADLLRAVAAQSVERLGPLRDTMTVTTHASEG